MLIRLGYEIAIDCPQRTPLISVLEIHPERQKDIQRQTRVLTSPSVPSTVYTDRYGNRCRRFVAPAGGFRILYDAVVEDSGQTDEVNTLAGETPVEKLLDYVHSRLSFGYGYARSTLTAAQAHDERVGVCRDFAHLAITFCRCMNIPARYVNGYLGDIGVPADPAPMDFSAWFEAWLDGKWYTFDARHNTPRVGRIVIARGRDATDVPLLHSFGPHSLSTFRVWTYEQDESGVTLPPRHGIDRTLTAQILA